MNNLNRKVKSVPFNLDDPYERELLKHSSQFKQFATYVKRLIQRDMDQVNRVILKEPEDKGRYPENPIDLSKIKSFGI
ncbi:hypothetical protein [Mesobacillus foraminis]|uniref:hypothetical protein n=1 Tax=Mesobacillus foraminis TaxID=279826 RepID=UPI000EF55585|nr:hypothetical protein [Mesobacillus foraminis]